MAGTPPEDLLEWLLREEENLGVDVVERATLDMEAARELLYRELGYEIKDEHARAFMEAGRLKYEKLPEVSISFECLPQPWGYQSVYRDIATGRFIKREDVSAAIDVVLR